MNIAFAVLDLLRLRVHGPLAPTDAEWNGYLLFVARTGVDRTMELIWSDGGCPTREQRRQLEQLIAGRTVPTAVVSASAGVRGTVRALSWFNPRVKAFPATSLREAMVFLEVPASRFQLIERELDKLRLELRGGLR